MAIGTRYRNQIAKSAAANNTRRGYFDATIDKGGFVINASNVTFTSTGTITSDDASFPVAGPDLVQGGTFADLVTNGAFGADTDWTKGAGWSIGAGVATASTAATALSQNISAVAGRVYAVTYTITRSAGSVVVSVGGTAGASRNSNGTYTDVITAGSDGLLAFTGTGFSGTVDDVIAVQYWTLGAGWTVSSGALTATTSNAAISQDVSGGVVEDRYYFVTYDITRSAGSVQVSLGGTNGVSRNSTASYAELIKAGSTESLAFTGTGFSGTVDNVVVEEVYLMPGQLIQVQGSPLNSRVWEVVTASPSAITVNPSQIQNEASGAAIDIRTV